MTSSKNQDRSEELSEFGQAAQWGASFGLKVFPLGTKSKQPQKGSKWKESATSDPEAIRDIWTKTPTANVGWLTGEPSGYFVVDVDGDIGEESVKELSPRLGRLPDTVTIITPGKIDRKTGKHKGKGRHLVFACPSEAVPDWNGIVPGIDIKSSGGYCVFPPSIHPHGTGQYEFAPDHAFGEIEVAELPPAWLEFLRGENKPKPSPKASSIPTATVKVDDHLLKQILAYVGKCEPAVQGQNGHGTLLKVAKFLVHGSCLEPSDAAAIAWEHYNPRCLPPWTEKERPDFERKFTEAANKPPRKERGWFLNEK